MLTRAEVAAKAEERRAQIEEQNATNAARAELHLKQAVQLDPRSDPAMEYWPPCISGGGIPPVASGRGAMRHGIGMRKLRSTIRSIGTLTMFAGSSITTRLSRSFGPHQDSRALLPTKRPVGPFVQRLGRYWAIAPQIFCARWKLNPIT